VHPSGAVEIKETRSEDVLYVGRAMRNNGESWQRCPKVRWRYLLRSRYYRTIRRRVLAATNAYEYDNVTARKQTLAKYTSDSCARTRACMLRTYYAKSGSCHKPVRTFRSYAKVGTVLTGLNPYTSENRVSKPLTGNSCCICEAGRGKARQAKAAQRRR